jgi:hypothetical protein
MHESAQLAMRKVVRTRRPRLVRTRGLAFDPLSWPPRPLPIALVVHIRRCCHLHLACFSMSPLRLVRAGGGAVDGVSRTGPRFVAQHTMQLQYALPSWDEQGFCIIVDQRYKD